MGLFSSITDTLFGNSGARSGAKNAIYTPSDINIPGFGGIDVTLLGKKGRGGQSTSFTMDPIQQLIGSLGSGLTVGGLQALPGAMNQDPFSNPLASIGLLGALQGLQNYGSGYDLSGLQSGASSLAGTLTDRGLGFLDMDFSDIARQTTDLLRQQALPFQERRSVGLADKLYGRGGAAISGVTNPALESLGMIENQEDLGFQLAGLNRADQLSNLYGGLGTNLLGLGSGLTQSADQFGLSKAGLGIQGDTALSQALSNLLQSGTGAYGTSAGTQQQNFANLLASIGLGENINQTDFQNMLNLITASTAQSTAKSGANANAGQLAAAGDGTAGFWDFVGGLVSPGGLFGTPLPSGTRVT